MQRNDFLEQKIRNIWSCQIYFVLLHAILFIHAMKKQVIILLCLFVGMATAVADTDCNGTLRVAKILFQQQKWEVAKVQCTSYLNQCGPNAEVQKMLNECNSHLSGVSKGDTRQVQGK